MADAPVDERTPAAVAAEAPRGMRQRARLTRRRLFGLDRSGPPPEATLAGAPLNPWTIPNAIGFTRAALIPVFVTIAYSTDDGHSALAAGIYAGVAWADYADGIAARVTGQYSRLGTLIDPFIDRLLVVSGLAICWSFELLPRWALGVLVIRELSMLPLARFGMKRGLELRINWPGRIGVWWAMAAPFWAMVGVNWLALLGLYVGIALGLISTAMYLRDGARELRGRRGGRAPAPSSSG